MVHPQSKLNGTNDVFNGVQGREKSRGKNSSSGLYQLVCVAILMSILTSIMFHRNSEQYHTHLHARTTDAPIIRPISPKAGLSNRQERVSQVGKVTRKPLQSVPAIALKNNETVPPITSRKNETASSKGYSCLQWNSQAWLEGSRLGNAKDSFATEQSAIETILGSMPTAFNEEDFIPTVLQQSLCDENSPFLQFTKLDGADKKNTQTWSVRLMYLAFHLNQHRPAVKEAIARSSSPDQCQKELHRHNIGPFDFECPDRKFLVVTMGKLGLGAVMRLGAVNALIAGVASNRTVLFINNAANNGPKFIRDPWIHSSCDRGDFQCFFAPITPCVVREKELENLYMLQRSEQRKLFKTGNIPKEHEEKRIVGADFVLRPQRTPATLRKNMLKLMTEFIDELSNSKSQYSTSQLRTLRRAAKLVLTEEPEDPSRPYNYFGARSKVHHAATFYTMRPKAFYAKKLRTAILAIFPKDFDPNRSLGLPIRASDKCIKESECLSFDQYMKLMGQIWKKNEGALQGAADIVLTSESEQILAEKEKYETNATLKSLVPFDYRFITNDGDVMQGTGNPNNFAANLINETSADDIMLSAITSLKTQLKAGFSVGNCCSNFHNLIFDFLRDGCGAAEENWSQCLQENEDPELRVCCQWTKTDECLKKKESKK